MNVKDTFLKLTSNTYPYGTEPILEDFLPSGYYKDKHGNYYYEIGESRTAFTCHLDTACKDFSKVKHVIEGNMIKTDGKTILGADDKAGMTILLYLIEKNVPGLYCFFIGEEVGCIGSGYASKDKKFESYDRMISFDRRGTTSIITHQSFERCCSDEFAKTLAGSLNELGLSMTLDDGGVYTDSAEFTEVIPECTNLSVGYYNEHTHKESQDIEFLEILCEALYLIDWESLPTKRDPNFKEYSAYSNIFGYNYKESKDDCEFFDDFDEYTYDYNKNKSKKVYFNNLNNEITSYVESDEEKKEYYEYLEKLFIEEKYTRKDLDKNKNLYLNFDDPDDMDFYNTMSEMLED